MSEISTPASSGEDLRRSPLVECDLASGADDVVSLSEQSFLGHLNLRGDVVDDVEEVFGLTLPMSANKVVQQGTAMGLWLGPDEWLLIHSSEEDRSRVADLQERVAAKHASVVDTSSGQTVVKVSGPGARDVLARGCPLDLHPREFRRGDCAQTHFDHIGITIWLDNTASDAAAAPWFNLVVRRSFADYLWRLLDEAAVSVRATAADA